MKKYPESPIELVESAAQEAIRKGGNPGYVDPILPMFQQAMASMERKDQKSATRQFQQAMATANDAVRRNPACANLRTKLSWAQQWAMGRLPGTMAADNQAWSSDGLGGDAEAPQDDMVKHAWMNVLSNGEWTPPVETPDPEPEGGEFTMEIPEPGEAPKAAQPTQTQTGVPKEQKGTKDKAEVTVTDDYADIQEAINKGIL